MGSGFEIEVLGFRACGLGLGLQDLGFRACGLVFKVSMSGLGLGFRL